jgi:hypothetical protein
MKKETVQDEFPSVKPRPLVKEELDRIDQIDLSYPYDFAPVSPVFLEKRKRECWSLAKFLDRQSFPFASLDIIDRLDLDAFDIEGFYKHIDLERLHLPGQISAVTTAKVIKYCLEILACEFNYKLHSRYDGAVKRLKVTDLAADKLQREIRRQAKEWQEQKILDEINIYLHFVSAMRHPVVQQGVHNAAVNRFGLSNEVQGGSRPKAMA